MNLTYTPEAVADLGAISDYIAQDSPARALSFIDEIEVHCTNLLDAPHSRPMIKEIGADIRRSVFGNYNIYYVIRAADVIVFGIIEGHRLQAPALKGRDRT